MGRRRDRGRVDGSTDEMLAAQTECSQLSSPAPTLKLSRVLSVYDSSSGVRQTPEAHWPASLARSLSFRFSERPWLKNQGGEWQGRHLTLTSDLYRQHTFPTWIRACSRTCTHAYTPHTGGTYVRRGMSGVDFEMGFMNLCRWIDSMLLDVKSHTQKTTNKITKVVEGIIAHVQIEWANQKFCSQFCSKVSNFGTFFFLP